MCLNSMPNEILFMIVNHLVLDLHSQEPTAPTQILRLASACKKFRQLIYPLIFKIGKLESNQSVYGSLLLSLDDATLDNPANDSQDAVSFICCLSNFSKSMTIQIPVNILKYIKVLTFPETFEPITLLCSKNNMITYTDCTMIVNPLIMPNLSTIILVYCAHGSFWKTLTSTDSRLYSYQRPLSVQLTFFASMPQISQKLQQLISSLSTIIENDNSKSFRLAWKNISGMSNLKALSISSANIDQIPNTSLKAASLIMQSLKGLKKLEQLYLDNCSFSLPVDILWLPETVTTLECSTSNFIDLQFPIISKKTNSLNTNFFQSVKILTIVVQCNNNFGFKRLPFNSLTELSIIGEGDGVKNQTMALTDEINAIIEELIKQNVNIERFSAVVSWDFAVRSALKRLVNTKQMNLSIHEFTLRHNALVLDELFMTISEFCIKLRKLSVRIVSSREMRPVLNYAVLAQFVASHGATTDLELLVHLKDIDEESAAFFERNLGQAIKPELFVPYLPLASAVGASELIARFQCKGYRKSLSYGSSWIIAFRFK